MQPKGARRAQDVAFGILPALGAVLALLAYGFLAAFPSPDRPPIPVAAPVAALTFATLQLLLPSSRPVRERLISPVNFAVIAFFVQLVALPLNNCLAGVEYGTLTYLPGASAIELSILISIAAFAAFSIGYAATARPGRESAPLPPGWLPRKLVIAYAAIGFLGLLFRFGSLGNVSALGDPERIKQLDVQLDGSAIGAASTFLRPFLINAIVMAWCLWVDHRKAGSGAPRGRGLVATALASLAVIFVGASYGFNRAAFMVPLGSMLAVYSVHVRRISFATLAALGLVGGALSLFVSSYRSSGVTAEELAKGGPSSGELREQDLQTQLQVYGNAPQFLAFAIEASAIKGEQFTLRTLLGSLMSPVPVLGKAFRGESGAIVYNHVIYGDYVSLDQILPCEGELYLSLGPLGLIVGFLLVGWAVAKLQRAFERAQSAYDLYVLQFLSVWVAFLVEGGLAPVMQIVVFFLWPMYGYAFIRSRRPPG